MVCVIKREKHIADEIYHGRLYKFYQSIDCLIVASNDDGRETFCLPMIEAAACCTPVISTNVGCAEELIIDGYNGFKVMNKSEIIEKAIGMYDFNKMGKNAREVVRIHWSWKEVIRLWDSFIMRYV